MQDDQPPRTDKPLTRAQLAMADAIDRLLDQGFVPDGQTRVEIVRVPTRSSPLLGRSGGVLARLGGRQRFMRTGTDLRATVGPRTVAIYRVTGTGVAGVAAFDTSDLAKLSQVLEHLT